jgi:hypothetical protein
MRAAVVALALYLGATAVVLPIIKLEKSLSNLRERNLQIERALR